MVPGLRIFVKYTQICRRDYFWFTLPAWYQKNIAIVENNMQTPTNKERNKAYIFRLMV